MDAIELRGVTRGFSISGSWLPVLDGIDLRVDAREVVSIVGPNGSGKSTLLRIMAGLLTPDAGSVHAFGTAVDAVDARVGLVFQEPRLLPWRDVLSNVAFPLELAGVEVSARERRAREMLKLTGLAAFEQAFPDQLSGGMAQRAALARALVPEPEIVLLDEPFSALDAMTRERLDSELLTLWGSTGTTIVLVTHSIAEAVFLSDRVLVISPRPGRIVADVSVDVARPRSLAGDQANQLSSAEAAVRSALAAGAASSAIVGIA